DGIATYTGLALSGPAGSYTLAFSAPDLEGIESGAVTLQTVATEQGQWSDPVDWPIVAIHTMLLPDARVLAMNRLRTPQVWDPATGNFKSVPPPANLFCAGHALLPDGRVFLAGGHIDDNQGLPNVTLFSPTTDAWTSLTPMARGRWYPTTTVMGNGDVVIIAGRDEDMVEVTIPEVWSNGNLRQLTGASQALPYYPRAFVAPDGRLYVAGGAVNTRFLSLEGNGSWQNGPKRVGEGRPYGSAVMYDDGKILYAGGGTTTNTAEIIDLNEPSPQWRWTSPMAHARRHLNLTVLPTGEVLATGGVAGTTFNDVSKGVHAAEMWNPETGQWRTLASNRITRGYHSTSLLLPDGRVLNAGSGEGAGAPDEKNAELFSPPYLLRGPRPEVTSGPTEVAYGAQFRLLTPQAGEITKVSLIRLGATTHAFDENQRFQWLTFTAESDGVTVTAPSSPNRAPPGHYLVFVLNGDDVPSVGKILRIQ
ncbi:MAG TPA: galactose oxidase-like domain-containing protein, partial [Gemmatimonadales bacterium]|nr:galactose oxidase-like domain-containing protein [Gemmatimonadales bacterium]